MSGRIIVMGSGELAPGLVATHRAGIDAAGADRVTVLDTPYGFQENADELTERIVDFFATSLVRPSEVAALRARDATPGAVARALATVRSSRYVFAGPGSPTYALGVWSEVGMGAALASVAAGGGTVCFASAAALSLGSHTIPVYEMYKVGEEPRWEDGLDVLAVAGLSVPVVPHWDNAEGGTHDTSRCYIGRRRFEALMATVPTGAIGVDEHTALVVDLDGDELHVAGRGGATLWRHDREEVIPAGEGMPLSSARELLLGDGAPGPTTGGTSRRTAGVDEAIERRDGEALLEAVLAIDDAEARTDAIVRLVDVASVGLVDPAEHVGGFVELILDTRRRARSAGDYDLADELRDGLERLGIEVRDTPEGATWSLRESGDHRTR